MFLLQLLSGFCFIHTLYFTCDDDIISALIMIWMMIPFDMISSFRHFKNRIVIIAYDWQKEKGIVTQLRWGWGTPLLIIIMMIWINCDICLIWGHELMNRRCVVFRWENNSCWRHTMELFIILINNYYEVSVMRDEMLKGKEEEDLL